MQSKKTTIIQGLFLEHLQVINGIKLTHREIDIIAFFICGRSAKKIAAFFSISPKTVENHTHNIMLKLGCNSRESIIDFIEKSGKFPILRKYYTTIVAQALFDKCLRNIGKTIHDQTVSCMITYPTDEDSKGFLASYLESSLKEAGVQTSVQNYDSPSSLEGVFKDNSVVYISPTQNHKKEKSDLTSSFSEVKNAILLFIPSEKNSIEILKDLKESKPLDFINDKRTFLCVFEILKKLLPDFNFEKIIADFQKEFEHVESLDGFKLDEYSLNKNKTVKNEHNFTPGLKLIFPKKKAYLFALCLLICFIPTLWVVTFTGEKLFSNKGLTSDQHDSAIRSELIIPAESVFLNRSQLISQINDRLKGNNGIQTIALVGIGGAGKTTLARSYAQSQKSPILWMINAETKETLNESFENLAGELAKSEEDQKLLRGILKSKLPAKREEEIIQFVRKRLSTYPNWFLIYDNVEKFTDIQKHFPKDPGTWGQGKVILTTRDGNIENNSYVNTVVCIKELTPEEKLNLFIKIRKNGDSFTFGPSQQEEAKAFLAEIPSFPLDVSVAAYYLKATNISYQNYLENMSKCSKDFSHVQENLLREAGDYTKTRYGIITLSVQHLIEKNSDFRDLLLFIALIDSQHIPRDLLIHFKNAVVVDDLIYHLKKYSLITNEVSSPYHSEPVFSIHRSTQAIILDYLIRTLDQSKNKSLVQNIAASLVKYMTDVVDKQDFAKMKVLSHHAEKVLDHHVIDGATQALIEGNLGCVYYYLRSSTKAKELLTESLETLNAYSPQNHNQIAYFLVYLGSVYRSLGNYEKAKELFEKSLSIYSKSNGNPLGLARASGYLAAINQDLGEFKKAKELLEHSMAIYQTYPENPIGVGWSMAHLGGVYKSLGDYEKAKELFEKSLAIYRKYSTDHVGAAWVAGNLGDTYLKLKNYQKAQDLLQESLIICKKHFPEDHVYVAKAQAHFGIFYREKGDYRQAKECLEKSLIAFEGTYGKNHLKTGFILKDLGQVYLMEGDFDTAENLLVKAFDIFEKNKHLDQYLVLESLATLTMNKSKRMQGEKETDEQEQLRQQAIAYLEKALEGIKDYLPEDSAPVVRVQENLNAYRQTKIKPNNPLEAF